MGSGNRVKDEDGERVIQEQKDMEGSPLKQSEQYYTLTVAILTMYDTMYHSRQLM